MEEEERETAKEMKWSFGFSRCKSFLVLCVLVLQRSSTKPKAAQYNKLKKEKKHLQELEGAIDRFGSGTSDGLFLFELPKKNKLPNYFCFCVAV